jgi:NAD(P)-dependent dehydrogenase (short-subunit alcohol dehydrogenase family)
MSSQSSISGRLAGKVAIITGGGGGIGRAIALRYAREGARVVVNDVKAEVASAVVAQIEADGGVALALPADVSDDAQVKSLFESTVSHFGTVDVLVNNASLVNTMRHVLEGDADWWGRIIAVNLSSAYHCSFYAAKIMAAKRSGVIINMSSGGASRAHRGNVAYDAAKGGVEAMTRALALDLGPYNVRVVALVPGSIDTSGMAPETKKQRGENIPLERVGEPDDMAGPAVFLASDDAAYVTGSLVYVDGGMLAQQRSASVDIFPVSRFPKLG